MTSKQRNFKAILIKQVHTSVLYKQVYKHDRDLYEQMLENTFGVKSSKDLSIDELLALVSFLNQKTAFIQKAFISNNQVSFLKSLWDQKANYPTEDNLLKLIYNKFKLDLKSINELHRKDFKKVVGLLKNLKKKELSDKERLAYSLSILKVVR